MVRIVIDGRPVEAAEGTTVLDAAASVGIDIPHFCYHPAFPAEGSCRACLIEVEGLAKLELACSTIVREGLHVITNSPPVREARRSALEFLLSEHPLDCPICDKAGECLLQEYSRATGQYESVFIEARQKREKIIPLSDRLILDRERCILCTRCVRFLRDVTRTRELGIFERALGTEIGLYEDEAVSNAYAGNLVDICPVGAITDRAFRFRTRVWFLDPRPAICPLCSRGCAIWADYHPGFPRQAGSAGIYRVRARLDPAVNGHWICDFGRYGAPGLMRERLIEPRAKGTPDGTGLSWRKAMEILVAALRSLRDGAGLADAAVVLNARLTSEELALAAKVFIAGLGIKRVAFADPPDGPADAMLLRSDRSPNRGGAERLGFKIGTAVRAAIDGASFVLVFAGDRDGLDFLKRDPRLLRSDAFKVLASAQTTGLEPEFDLVLPTAAAFEKAGTFVNAAGRARLFSAVHAPCGNARPEWMILAELGRGLGLDKDFIASLAGLEDVARRLDPAYPMFGEGR